MYATTSRPGLAPETSRSVVRLPRQIEAHSLASTLRETATGFMNGSEHWGKAQLAMWLMGPYGRWTRYADPQAEGFELPPWWKSIDPRFVQRMMEGARSSVLGLFRDEIATENVGAFAADMIDAGFVVLCRDEHGVEGWLPTTRPQALSERVLSLFAADCLSRPAEFAAELSVCRTCSSVGFDALARERGICHRHQSGFFDKRTSGAPPSFFPEGA